MSSHDRRIDEYIASAAPFAQPILAYVRQVVHAACPDVEETMKWRFPHFTYHGILCGVAAFKEHCALVVWQPQAQKLLEGKQPRTGLGQLGKITSLKELPSKAALMKCFKMAMKLNEAGVKRTARRSPAKALRVPVDLRKALHKNDEAATTFADLSTSHRNEYVEWLTEAKQEATRAKRLATTLEWLAEGKSRNWKYERKSSREKA